MRNGENNERRGSLRAWLLLALAGLAVAALAAAVAIPMLLRAGPHGPPEPAALQILKSLRHAEEVHRIKVSATERYTNLDGLKAGGLCSIGEGEREPTTGYTFTSAAGKDTYTIVAIPPTAGQTTYTLDESGDIFP